jgi:hypothetical protein
VEISHDLLDLIRQAQNNAEQGSLLADAVRASLDAFATKYPGRSVEVRVPPYRVVQILGGATHRRGTPPAVVEMSPTTWLGLITSDITWAEALASGQIQASGIGSDLAELFS